MYFSTSPATTIKAYSEKELNDRIQQHLDTDKFELIGKKERKDEFSGATIWYAKLRRKL